MVKQLIDRPHDALAIRDNACGCVVTIEEHDALTRIDRQDKEVDGWDRYRRAGIAVIDRSSGERVT
jgi:hypothetical protein